MYSGVSQTIPRFMLALKSKLAMEKSSKSHLFPARLLLLFPCTSRAHTHTQVQNFDSCLRCELISALCMLVAQPFVRHGNNGARMQTFPLKSGRLITSIVRRFIFLARSCDPANSSGISGIIGRPGSEILVKILFCCLVAGSNGL